MLKITHLYWLRITPNHSVSCEFRGNYKLYLEFIQNFDDNKYSKWTHVCQRNVAKNNWKILRGNIKFFPAGTDEWSAGVSRRFSGRCFTPKVENILICILRKSSGVSIKSLLKLEQRSTIRRHGKHEFFFDGIPIMVIAKNFPVVTGHSRYQTSLAHTHIDRKCSLSPETRVS